MKNLNKKLRYSILIVASCILITSCTSCTYKHKGKIVKDMDGKIYRIQKDARVNEGYNLIELDSSKYNILFNN